MRAIRSWLVTAAVAAVAGTLAATAGATIIATSPQAVKIAPPASVQFDALESNTEIRVFDEQQCVTLAQDVEVDITLPGTYDESADLTNSGVIPAGTKVSSHFMHADKVGPPPHGFVTLEGSMTTDADILGIAILQRALDRSDFLGAPGTLYPTGDFGRRLNLDNQDDFIVEQVDVRTVTLHAEVNQHADQVRVITKCKERERCKVIGLGKLSHYKAFAFLVGNQPPAGGVLYVDKYAKKTLKSTSITSVDITDDEQHATIKGTGKVNNTTTVAFTIVVDDVSGPDSFSISWPGYSAGGQIWWGGVAILCGDKCDDDHKPELDH